MAHVSEKQNKLQSFKPIKNLTLNRVDKRQRYTIVLFNYFLINR